MSSVTSDRFAMAEQAVNTINALGERPDLLCNDIIKSLSKKVFGNPPSASQSMAKDVTMSEDGERDDASAIASTVDQSTASGDAPTDRGDAFQLAQLIFIVGHIAIKHIVFLELVERELKRQKEGVKGMQVFGTLA